MGSSAFIGHPPAENPALRCTSGRLGGCPACPAPILKGIPFDLEDTHLDEYKNLIPEWQDWSSVETAAMRVADLLFESL